MLLTYYPLPKFKHFISMFVRPLSDNKLSETWCVSGDKYRWFSCSAYSLAALVALKSKKTSTEKIIIWVPNFFCNSTLEPLRKLNIQIFFYPIKQNFEPDFDWCYKNCAFYSPAIFLLVHYFGNPVKSAEAKNFCECNNAWLVEDAAHCFLPVNGVGDNGDFVIYSPHKHIAIMDGAILVIRKSGQEKIEMLDLEELDTVFDNTLVYYRTRANIIFIVIWLLKRFLQMIGLRFMNKNFVFWPEAEARGPSFNHREMSKISKVFLSNQLKDLNEYVNQRKSHHKLWKNKLLPNILKITELQNQEVIPYLAQFQLIHEGEIDDLYKILKQIGVPVTTWPDLPPEVIADSINHMKAVKLRKSRIFVNVHQSLNSEKIIKLCQGLV